MRPISVGVLGACGWMGKVHTGAYLGMRRQFPDLAAEVRLRWLADENLAALEKAANLTGATRISTDWTDVVDDPEVDLVDICLPDKLHYPVAKAALEAGKHVYCEKPLTDSGDEARELAAIAARKGLTTRVGHSFPVNPVHRLARRIIENGEIGAVTLFRGAQHVDSHGSPDAPFIWRLDGALAPTGIVGDTGSHVFSFMDYLVGEVDEITAHCPVIFSERPEVKGAAYGGFTAGERTGKMLPVGNPDLGMLLCRFKGGAVGVVDFSRIATGKRFMQRYEVFGTKGAITYDYDEICRLNVYRGDDPAGQQGFRAIDIGPEAPEYGAFLPLANFGLGYNEIKMVEAKEVIQSIATGASVWPTFSDAARIVAVVDACIESHQSRRWVKIRS
jgi:predicted dehydrogenase